ncbi:MAG: HEPN domain-containing protein [Verrucomicrobiota bacterium]|nr:HEPN domain-containing protein [Verrucomicrobiota bacterium]
MKPATREWVRCAEEDFDVAGTLLRRRTKTAANTIGFHCQQCLEKYLKARLEEMGMNVPRTHDLVALLQLLLPAEPLWASFAPALRRLNDYAVKFRYPGHTATRADAIQALKACRSVRADIRLSLGLPRR